MTESAKKRKLDELNTAYRLAGKTLVRLRDEKGVAVRIDTSFESEFNCETSCNSYGVVV